MKIILYRLGLNATDCMDHC